MQFQPLLLVVLALAGGATAGEFCSRGDAKLVMQQWSAVYNSATAGVTQVMIGRQVFDSLFKKAPGAIPLFNRVNVDDMHSGEFSAHVMRVMGGLDICINSLLDQETLTSITDHLSAQHVVRSGVTKGGFAVMGKVLMCSLSQVVEDFNPDMWENCLTPILDAMSRDLPE